MSRAKRHALTAGALSFLVAITILLAGQAEPIPSKPTVYTAPIVQRADGGICATYSYMDRKGVMHDVKTETIYGLAPGAPEWQKAAAVEAWVERTRIAYNASLGLSPTDIPEQWCEKAPVSSSKKPPKECGGEGCWNMSFPGHFYSVLVSCSMCVCPYDCQRNVYCCPGNCPPQCTPCDT